VNKYFGTRICVTEETVKLCPDFTFRPIGDVVLKGKEKAVVLYAPIQDTAEETKITGEYMAAYAQLKDEKPEGIAAFQVLRAQYPDDPIIAYHGRRIDEGATSTLIILGDK
jgi:adenylate cyclase